MCNLRFHVLLLIGCIWTPLPILSIPDDWQSSTNLSSNGLEFSPVDQQALLLTSTTASSILSCTQLCHSSIQCRIFDFDGQSGRCRLFEGNIAAMGTIVASASSQSGVGSIKLRPQQFINLGEVCSSCQQSRYLTCVNNTYQCPTHTYFDGSICQSQQLLWMDCHNSTECRNDLNYICLPRMQCGLVSIQTATVTAGNANGTAGSTLSSLNYPTGLSTEIVHALYVADYLNHRVMKFLEGSLNGSIVAGTGIRGNAASELNGPTGIHVDGLSNIYVADSLNYRVMFWAKNATVGIKVAGTGSTGSTLSSFGAVAGVFVDSQGNIYLSDTQNHRVMKFRPNVTNAVIVAGTGSAGSSSFQLNTPYGIFWDEVNFYLYVVDRNNHRIQRYRVGVSTNGTSVAGGNGQGSGSNQLSSPYSVCVSKISNAIYIADSGNNRIQRWNSGATSGVTIAGNATSLNNNSTPLQGSMDIRLDINDTNLFVSEAFYNRILRFRLV